jgi:hypothetical protein
MSNDKGKEKDKNSDLTSTTYLDDVVEYVQIHSPHLKKNGNKANGNCPFCQNQKDNHKTPFGVWCNGETVLLACHNLGCAFGTTNGNGKGNNIFDFIIHCGDAPDIDGALKTWCQFIGVEWHEPKEKQEEHLVTESDFQDLENGLFFAIFSGNYKHKHGGKVAKFKRLLRQQCGQKYQEIQNEVWCKTKEKFNRRKKEWNATYLGGVVLTQLRSFYREMLDCEKYEPKSFSSLAQEKVEQAADTASYRGWCEEEYSIGKDKAKARQALKLAKERLTDVELRIASGECTLRQAEEETGVPFNTIRYRKDKKIEGIRKELGIEPRKTRKLKKSGEKVEGQDDEKNKVVYTKIYTAKDYSQDELRKLVPSCE